MVTRTIPCGVTEYSSSISGPSWGIRRIGHRREVARVPDPVVEREEDIVVGRDVSEWHAAVVERRAFDEAIAPDVVHGPVDAVQDHGGVAACRGPACRG